MQPQSRASGSARSGWRWIGEAEREEEWRGRHTADGGRVKVLSKKEDPDAL